MSVIDLTLEPGQTIDLDLTPLNDPIVLEVSAYVGEEGPQGNPGPTGPTGPAGPAGAPGAGVPVGGNTDDALLKASNADGDTAWVPVVRLSTAQVITGQKTFEAQSITDVPITVKAFAAQLDDVTQYRNSVGELVLGITSDGGIHSGDWVSYVGLWDNPEIVVANAAHNGYANMFSGATRAAVVSRAAAGQTEAILEAQDEYSLQTFKVNNASPNVEILSQTAAHVALSVKGSASQTGDLQQWKDSTGVVQAQVGPSGYFRTSSPSGSSFGGSNISGVMLAVRNIGATSTGIVNRGTVSQTGDLQQWQDSAGATLAVASATGRFRATGSVTTPAYAPLGDAASGMYSSASGTINIGVAGIEQFRVQNASRQVYIPVRSAAYIGFTVRGTASQTGDLQTWEDSAGTAIARVFSAGEVYGRSLFAGANLGARLSVSNVGGNTGDVISIVKGAVSQTADFVQWQNSSGGVLAGVGSAGRGYFGATQALGNAALSVAAINVASPVFLARGGASQTGSLTEWQDSTGTIVSSVRSNGKHALGTAFGSPAAWLSIAIDAGTTPGIQVKAAASQSANIQEWQDSSGVVLSRITSSGNLSLSAINSLGGGGPRIDMLGAPGPVMVTTQAATNVGLGVKAAASQTANLQEWQDSTGTAIALVNPSGDFQNYAKLKIGTGSLAANTRAQIATNVATDVVLMVKAAASQSASLQQWQNSAGSVLAQIHAGGNATFYNGLNAGSLSTAAMFNVDTLAAGTIGAIVKGAASQTADLQQWQNSAGTVLAKATAAGLVQGTSLKAVGGAGTGLVMGDGTGWSAVDTVAGTTEIRVRPAGVSVMTITSGGTLAQITAQSATDKPLVLKAAASQSVDLLEWQDSTGALLGWIGQGGGIIAPNVLVGTAAGLGGGTRVLAMQNASVVPSTNPSGGGVQYVEAGALKYRGSAGTVTTLAPA